MLGPRSPWPMLEPSLFYNIPRSNALKPVMGSIILIPRASLLVALCVTDDVQCASARMGMEICARRMWIREDRCAAACKSSKGEVSRGTSAEGLCSLCREGSTAAGTGKPATTTRGEISGKFSHVQEPLLGFFIDPPGLRADPTSW